MKTAWVAVFIGNAIMAGVNTWLGHSFAAGTNAFVAGMMAYYHPFKRRRS